MDCGVWNCDESWPLLCVISSAVVLKPSGSKQTANGMRRRVRKKNAAKLLHQTRQQPHQAMHKDT